MGNLIEVGQVILAIAVFGYIFYLLVFSGREAARREAQTKAYRGFERREIETPDRRLEAAAEAAKRGDAPETSRPRTTGRRAND